MKITKSKLKQIILEEYNASIEEGSGDRNDPDREQGHGAQRQREGSAGNPGEYLEEAEVLAEEKSAIITKIVDIVKRMAAKHGPDFIDMVVDSLKDAAMDAMASQGDDGGVEV